MCVCVCVCVWLCTYMYVCINDWVCARCENTSGVNYNALSVMHFKLAAKRPLETIPKEGSSSHLHVFNLLPNNLNCKLPPSTEQHILCRIR